MSPFVIPLLRYYDIRIQQEHSHFQNQSSILENVGSALGGLFDIQPQGTDYDEAEFQRQQKLKKKKKRGLRRQRKTIRRQKNFRKISTN